jgi:hypothetical protein
MSLLYLGAERQGDQERPFEIPADHFVTHGVVVGMTGSGKTGLVTVLVEEALRSDIPVLLIDIKGDLPNLALTLPSFTAEEMLPWVEAPRGATEEQRLALAQQKVDERRAALATWGITPTGVKRFHERRAGRIITPGASSGALLHVQSSLERRSPHWDTDPESARATLSAAISLVLRLVGRDADPARSREHVLLAVFAERRLLAGQPADIASLLADLEAPPIDRIGALPIERFLTKKARRELAASLNSLLASPTFASWRQGASLDVAEWLTPKDGKTPATIVSVAHLDDDERALVLGVVLEEVLSWVRGLPGSQSLRALIVFDEVYGFLPPHPASPPTKRPLVALMKQARAFGVGVVLATQNPMDLDYRALSNAGVWCVGRLQTDADRARVVEGMRQGGGDDFDYDAALRHLPPRRFLVRDARRAGRPVEVQPRWAISLMRGPMTRGEVARVRQGVASAAGKAPR